MNFRIQLYTFNSFNEDKPQHSTCISFIEHRTQNTVYSHALKMNPRTPLHLIY